MKSAPVFGRLGQTELVAQPAKVSKGFTMKHILSTLLISALLASLGSAFAQSASHELEIRIPNVLMLRITDGSSNSAAVSPAVNFDFQAAANVDTYLDMVNGGGGNLLPTSVNNFGDVIVFSNRATWNVTVAASVVTFANNLGIAGITGNGVALSDISVTPSGTAGLNVSSVSASWDLTGSTIANGVRTQGWRSLGFGGDDYRFSVNGDEDPGTYTTTVTYTIAAP